MWREEQAPTIVNYLEPACRAAGVYIGHALDTAGFDSLRMVIMRGDPIGPTGPVVTMNITLLESDTPDARDAEVMHDPSPLDARDAEVMHDPNPLGGVARTPKSLAWTCHRLGRQAGRKRFVRVALEIIGAGLLPCAILMELHRAQTRRPASCRVRSW